MDKTALVIIDVQQEYFAPVGRLPLPQGPDAVKQIVRTLDWARDRGLPVFHIVHESQRPNASIFAPGSPGLAIHPDVKPAAGEPIIQKHLPGAFTGTPLEEELKKRGVEQLVIAGFMTQMCVDTTTRQAAHLGYKVTVLSDATAAMDVKDPDGKVIPAEAVHRTHLGSLSGFLADIKRADQLR